MKKYAELTQTDRVTLDFLGLKTLDQANENSSFKEYSKKYAMEELEFLQTNFKNYVSIIVYCKATELEYNLLDNIQACLIVDGYILTVYNSKNKVNLSPHYKYFMLTKNNNFNEPEPNKIGVFSDKKINDWINYCKAKIDYLIKQNAEDINHTAKIEKETVLFLKKLNKYLTHDHGNSKHYKIGGLIDVYFKKNNTVSEAKYQFNVSMSNNSNVLELLSILK